MNASTPKTQEQLKLLWGATDASVISSTLFIVKAIITLLVVTVLVIFDLFRSGIRQAREVISVSPYTWLGLFIFTVIVLVLYLFWPQVIWILKTIIVPILQILFDLIRIIWNVFLLLVLDILIQIYNELAPTLFFLLEFAVNTLVFIIVSIVEALGELDLPGLFEMFMEILTPIVEMWLEVIKVLIDAAASVIKALIPIVTELLKLYILYLKIIFKVYGFLFRVLFFILRPLIPIIIRVVFWYIFLFCRSCNGGDDAAGVMFSSARWAMADQASQAFGRRLMQMATEYARAPEQELDLEQEMESLLMSFLEPTHPSVTAHATKKPARPIGPQTLEEASGGARNDMGGETVADVMASTMYEYATELFDAGEYDRMYEHVNSITTEVMKRNAVMVSEGVHLDPKHVVPDYDNILYGDVNVYFEQMVESRPEGPPERDLLLEEQPSEPIGYSRQLKSVVHAYNNYKSVYQDPADDEETEEPISLEDSPAVESSTNHEATFKRGLKAHKHNSTFRKWMDVQQGKHRAARSNKHVNLTKHHNHIANITDPHGEDHWLINHARNMHPHTVFPGKKTKTYTRIDLTGELHPVRRGEDLHKQRRYASAYLYATKAWYRQAYKRHIRTGNFQNHVAHTFKSMTGHHSIVTWAMGFRHKYVNAKHFLHEVIPWPDLHANNLTRMWAESDPEFSKKPTWHQAVRAMGYADGKLPRSVYEQYEAALEHQEEYGILPWEDYPMEQQYDEGSVLGAGRKAGSIPRPRGGKRQSSRVTLADPTVINIKFLYEGKSCTGTGSAHFILCLPRLPKNARIPEANLAELFMLDRVSNDTFCDPPWRPLESCFPCLNDFFGWNVWWNALTEVRMSTYLLDIPFYIFGIGFLFPEFGTPTAWVGLLAKYFPAAGTVLQFWFPYPIGTKPPASAWLCFIHFFWTIWFPILVIGFYLLFWDWLVQWAGRAWQRYRVAIVALYARYTARQARMEQHNHRALLYRLNALNRAKRSSRDRLAATGVLLSANTGDGEDLEAGAPPVGFANTSVLIGDEAVDSGPSRRERASAIIASDSNRAELIDLTEREMALKELQKKIIQELDRLSGVLGVGQFNEHRHTIEREEAAWTSWHSITHFIQMPYQMTLSYATHLTQYHEHLQRTHPPPNAEHFRHIIEDGKTVPVSVVKT